jgi:DNA-binding PadR family transcriptional regulator
MTKAEILSIFDRAGGFLTPDQVRTQLHWSLDPRSVYSYLLRLCRQGLLERNEARRGSLAYRITDRGRQRLEYLRRAG